MSKWNHLKLQEFLSMHPRMRLTEYGEKRVVVVGEYDLNAQMDGHEAIQETYRLQLVFPARFPKDIPTVADIESRIPRNLEYHTYKDGTFCLGSEIKLKSILHENPTVTGFVDKILDPFLYAVSYKILFNLYPFGDLDHGEAGLIDDYRRLFNVSHKASVLQVLRALGKRKREANKLRCPCGCGSRIGKCNYRFGLKNWRRLERRRWFRKYLAEFIGVTFYFNGVLF